jgi:ribosomal protein S8
MRYTNYVFGNFINQLNLAMLSRRLNIDIFYNDLALEALELLLRIGAIHSYHVVGYSKVRVYLKYHEGRRAVKFGIVSTPGRRIY